MANICEYKVIVKGRKNACYAFFGSMSCLDDKQILEETGTAEQCTIRFEGNCKWSVDSYCTPWDGAFPVLLPEDADAALSEGEEKYWYNTVQDRSRMFEVEVWCNSADIDDYDPEEGPCEIFEHYIHGEYAGGICPVELRIQGEEAADDADWADDSDWDEDDSGWGDDAGPEEKEPRWEDSYPMIKSIEGTGYAGRTARIEFVKEGDMLILKADYNSPFYSPVAIEVFNAQNETLGFLQNGWLEESLEEIAKHLDALKARVASVTPLSRRTKRAKYALMDVELFL